MTRQRVHFPNAPTNARKVYPTPYAESVRGTEPRANTGLGEQDNDATRCAQCGFPIENRNARATCPLCDSDNFEGHRGPNP